MAKNPESQGRYGALIKQARKAETQPTSQPENQIGRLPENQITREPDLEVAKEKEVNLCVKVPESLRRHWAAESKRQGITMTEVIIEALTARFGKPD